jgi:transaldolase
VPETTLAAFADHGRVGELLPPDGGDGDEVLVRFRLVGIDITLADLLQRDGAQAFTKSWDDLLLCIRSKDQALKRAV